MVQILFSGAWSDSEKQAVREIIRTQMERCLKISVSPAYFEEILEPSARKNACWENPIREMPARVPNSEDLSACLQTEKQISIIIAVFPAGSARARRMTAAEVQKAVADAVKISKKSIFVTLDAPPQERRSYAAER